MPGLYLFLAVLGTVLPVAFFLPFFAENGLSLWTFVEAAYATLPAGGLTTDLIISSVVFWVWSYGEASRKKLRGWWVFVVLNLFVGLSLAFPAFLVHRARSGGDGS